jgi:hypothetical protein
MADTTVNGFTADVQALVKERDGLKQRVVDLEQERDSLRKALAATEAERDCYLQSLHASTRREVHFSERELEELRQNGVPAEQFLAELKQAAKS